jgi:hypothetical protein
MFKRVLAAALISVLAACSGMPMSGYSTAGSSEASWAPPRSPGEGPSFHPVYP